MGNSGPRTAEGSELNLNVDGRASYHLTDWQIIPVEVVLIRMTETEKPRRKRRHRRTIVREKAAKEARRLEREVERAERDRLAEEKKRVQLQAGYDAQIRYEASRAKARVFQEQGVEWLMGYNTPAAKLFQQFADSHEAAVKDAGRRARSAGDPLNLTGHTPKPSKKQQRRQAEAERLARGERTIIIPDNESPNQNVLVSTMPHSFRRVKQLKVHHEPAAERFVRDWEMAGYSGLSSPGFDPRVDTSAKAHAGHLRATEAQKRLMMVQGHIGQRNFDICKGVLILNLSVSHVHALGGRAHRSVSNDIEVALNALAGFYDPVRLDRDPTWRAFQRALEVGLGVIAQGEALVR